MANIDELRQTMRLQRRKLHALEAIWAAWRAREGKSKAVGIYPSIGAMQDAIAAERAKLLQMKAAIKAFM